MTALREANQLGDLQPTVLVSYRADLRAVFDMREEEALIRFGLNAKALADPGWRSAMLDGQPVPTQNFARALIAEGFVGLLVRSFAIGTSPANLNLVLWRWSGEGCMIFTVDGEDRLGRI